MNASVNTPNHRKEVMLFITRLDTGIAAHFAYRSNENNKLVGSDSDLWFPLSTTASLAHPDFNEIETIMKMNRVANNIVRIEPVRHIETSHEYLVTFNEYVRA